MYSADIEFIVKSKMLAALAFVSLENMIKALDKLLEYLPDNIMPVFDYFEDNFIGRLIRRIRRKPKFEHKLWNLYVN